jgi:hypothetical protein
MNCKPGDLAFTVAPVLMEKRGMVYEVVRASTPEDHIRLRFGWSDQMPCWVCVSSKGETIYADGSLRPIRAPGEDAKDETLTWLPVPSAGVRHRSAA